MKCNKCNNKNMKIKAIAGSEETVMCSFSCSKCLNCGVQFIPMDSFSDEDKINIKKELAKLKEGE